MATGAHVVARRCAGAAAYVGEAGSLYATEDEAVARAQATTAWSDERWRRAEIAAVDRAYARFADAIVLRPLLGDWVALQEPRQARVTTRA